MGYTYVNPTTMSLSKKRYKQHSSHYKEDFTHPPLFLHFLLVGYIALTQATMSLSTEGIINKKINQNLFPLNAPYHTYTL